MSTRERQPPLVLLVLPHCQEAQAVNPAGLLGLQCISVSLPNRNREPPCSRVSGRLGVSGRNLLGPEWQPLCFVACLIQLRHTGMSFGAVMQVMLSGISF